MTPDRPGLHLSARQAGRLLDTVPDAAFLRDPDGRFVYVNRAGAGYLGATEMEVLGRTIDDLFSHEHAERLRAEDQRVLAGETVESTFAFTLASGTEVTFRVVKSPLRDEDGGVVGVAGLARLFSGATEEGGLRHDLEVKLVQAQKLESLRVMAGGIAHDFNNLLAAILGNAELALKTIPSDSSAHDCLLDIGEATRRAAELSRQMLAFAGQGPMTAREVDLNEELLRAKPLLESSISKKALLTLDLAEPLPRILADPGQVRQMVLSLVTNASEALGGSSGEIVVRTDLVAWDQQRLSSTYVDDNLSAGDYVLLQVEDEGCGIPAGAQHKIFEPFYSDKFAGRGLGLAAVLGIARGHRGAVEVESIPGEGTILTVAFPAAQTDESAREHPPRRRRITTPAGEPAGVVMVVDDEAAVRSVGKRLLEAAGFEVETAADGLAALERISELDGRVDIVLLDLTMPRLDGDETYARIRERYPELPVVLVSGYGEMEVRERFHGVGLAGFIQKPYNPSNLVRTLRMVLSERTPVEP